MITENKIREHFECLANMIEKSVVETNIDDIRAKKSILIVKSTRNEVLYDFLRKANWGTGINVFILGEHFVYDDKYIDLSANVELLITEGRFDTGKMYQYKELVGDKNIDAIVFLGYRKNSDRYRNVEDVVFGLNTSNAPIYEYLASGELLRWKNNDEYIELREEYLDFINIIRDEYIKKK